MINADKQCGRVVLVAFAIDCKEINKIITYTKA